MIKPISCALASFGMSGYVFHGPLLQVNPHFEVKKILERNHTRSKKYFTDVEIVTSYEQLLNDPDIELVVVNTPDPLHYQMTRDALMAGKHVVVEKPFVQHVDQGLELIELAKKQKKTLTVFQNRRWDGDFMTVRKIIESNLLGRLVEFESHFDRFRNFIQDSWKEDAAFGTGTTYNLGSHMIDQAVVLFGKPEYVQADIRIARTNGKVDDSYDIRLGYPSIKVTLKGSYLVREAGPRYILHGTEGSFLKWGLDPQEDDLKAGKKPDSNAWGTEPSALWGTLNTNVNGLHTQGKIETLAGNYNLFYNQLFDCIRNNSEVPVNASESLLGILIIEAAYQSSRDKSTIYL